MNVQSRLTWNALLAALCGLPIAAIFYLGESVAELPFLPADFMNWLIPFIPGDLITFGISTMVDLIIFLGLGREDVVAKLFESVMAGAILVGILGGVGALMGEILHSKRARQLPSPLVGLLLGIAVAIPLAIISDDQLTGDNPFYSGQDLATRTAWVLGIVGLWGMITQLVMMRSPEATAETTEQAETPTVPLPDTTDTPPTRPAEQAFNPITVPVTRASVQKLSRRQFLIQVGGTTAAITVIGAGLGEWLQKDPEIIAADQADFSFLTFPNANARVMPAPGTRPEYTPIENHYRIDINSSSPPSIDGDAWRLTIDGLVANPTRYQLSQLQNDFTPMNQYVTISCISNRIGGSLIGTTGWTGVSMQDILDEVQPSPEATHIRITSADGFWEFIELDLIREDPRVMLCYAWNEELLREKHGFPLRIYIPDRYGMKQPKWITELEFVDAWGQGYWVERGWSAQAIVQTTSVVDTVAVNDRFEVDGQTYIPVGGIAYAGARGISKVEVRVDDGEWTEAQLRTPLSDLTWVVWRYDWLLQAGEHTFEVRCYDETGTLQVEEVRANKPSGATGIHSLGQVI